MTHRYADARAEPTHKMMRRVLESGVEHIIGVAVKTGDGRVLQLHWPCRHCHVIHMLAQALPDWRDTEARAVQGFVTNLDRFVDRLEGAQLALAAGQIEKLRWPPELYSEDLW